MLDPNIDFQKITPFHLLARAGAAACCSLLCGSSCVATVAIAAAVVEPLHEATATQQA